MSLSAAAGTEGGGPRIAYAIVLEDASIPLRPDRVEGCGGVGRLSRGSASTLGSLYHDVSREWPEVVNLHAKLGSGGARELSEADKRVLREIAESTGWDEGDVVEEVANLGANPSERVGRYREIFEEYYGRALELKRKGDAAQAGEKLWGAVLALIKLYAAIKEVPVAHWSRGKVERFITYSIEEEHRRLFRDLVDKAHALHENFYERILDPRSLEERWAEAVELLEGARRVVFKALAPQRGQ